MIKRKSNNYLTIAKQITIKNAGMPKATLILDSVGVTLQTYICTVQFLKVIATAFDTINISRADYISETNLKTYVMTMTLCN